MELKCADAIKDSIREGFRSYDLGAQPLSDINKVLLKGHHRAEQLRLESAGAIHGYHAPYRMFQERDMVSHCGRLPGTGLKSSMLSLEVLMGVEDRISLGEFVDAPCPAVSSDRLSIHEMAELSR